MTDRPRRPRRLPARAAPMTARLLRSLAVVAAGSATGFAMVTAAFAIARQDGRGAVIAAVLLGGALLVWWAAHPVTSSSTATRRASVTRAGCTHPAAVPVTSTITGQTLAALCPACDAQLPAEAITTTVAFAGLRADTAAIRGILTGLDTQPRGAHARPTAIATGPAGRKDGRHEHL